MEKVTAGLNRRRATAPSTATQRLGYNRALANVAGNRRYCSMSIQSLFSDRNAKEPPNNASR
jgi:hypothetical protein